MRQEDAAGGRDWGEDSWGRKEGSEAREDMLGESGSSHYPKEDNTQASVRASAY